MFKSVPVCLNKTMERLNHKNKNGKRMREKKQKDFEFINLLIQFCNIYGFQKTKKNKHYQQLRLLTAMLVTLIVIRMINESIYTTTNIATTTNGRNDINNKINKISNNNSNY